LCDVTSQYSSQRPDCYLGDTAFGPNGAYFRGDSVDRALFISTIAFSILENPAQEVIVSDQTRLVVDAFARYMINDVLKFYQTIGTVKGTFLVCQQRCRAAPRIPMVTPAKDLLPERDKQDRKSFFARGI
jgi:hypothetical protein